MGTNCEALIRYAATERQREVLEEVRKQGSHSKAAKALGTDRRSVDRTVARVKERAAKKGWAPEHDMTHPSPDPFSVSKVSTYYLDGEKRAEWVQQKPEKERLEAIYREVLEAMKEELPRERKVKKGKGKVDGELLNFYVLADLHLGMAAWHEETGENWDTEIAEDLLIRWFQAAIDSSPDAEVGVLAELGDGLHWDGLKALTPEHGNVLDADTRYAKLVRVVIRAFRRVVRMLLEKHDRVHLIFADGNHDEASSVWLRESFAEFYADEDRVTVDQSPDPFYCVEWGDTSLFLHHGHLVKPKNVDDVFVAKFRDIFGRTKYSYGHLGHFHHRSLIESSLMLIEQHGTIAAPDSYASRHGYMSQRGASVVTYSRSYGEVGRVTLSPEMVTL